MKRILIIWMSALLFVLQGCQSASEDLVYSADEPILLEMAGDSLKILQLTDLHLKNRMDPEDFLTRAAIVALVDSDDFDLVVITGDMALGPYAPAQFGRLVELMESLGVPWTFSFGNHETDEHDYQDYLSYVNDTEYLAYQVGPDLGDGACGVFRIVFTKETIPFYTLYLLDSHPEDEEGRHSHISVEQVAWYEEHVAQDATHSIVFTHIPLIQFEDPIDYIGVFEEDKVYSQDQETGLFAAMVEQGKTVAFFAGHDHLNDFQFDRDGVLLAYGRVTGYNDYGDLEKGGRIIEIDASGTLSTFIRLEKDAR